MASNSMKIALSAGFAGLALIAGAGILTALDHVHGTQPKICAVPADLRGKVAPAPQILAVEAGTDAKAPVIELGRLACITVAGVRSSVELAPLRMALQAAQSSVADSNSQLQAARANLLSASGDARNAAQQKVSYIKAGLSERIAALTEAQAALTSATPSVPLALYLNGEPTPAHATAAGVAEPQAVAFLLDSPNDANSADATSVRHILRGLTSGGSRDIVIGVGPPSGTQPLAEWVPPDPRMPAQLRVYSPPVAWMAGIGFILLLVGIFLAGRTTSLLRDGDATSAYSLARSQMAFWMIATVFGFVFIWVLTHEYQNVITAATFTLLGISGTTAIAAKAIDANSAPQPSKGFLTDILSDGQGGPQVHRIQVVIWTLVLGTIYVSNIFDSLVLTAFDSNLLILVGIANGVYAGFKTQES
jgi:hypothetical protein